MMAGTILKSDVIGNYAERVNKMVIKRKNQAQSTLEFAILIAVITAALVAMTVYIKRAIQGRLRTAADDISEQYSPTLTNANITTTSNSVTTSDTTVEDEGTLDFRAITTTNATENSSRQGYEDVQGYKDEPMF